MKIKVTEKSYEDVMALPQAEHRKPLKHFGYHNIYDANLSTGILQFLC